MGMKDGVTRSFHIFCKKEILVETPGSVNESLAL